MNKIIKVKDYMQVYEYELVEPIGSNFHPEFEPELTPKEMLALGVFGGKYMNDCKSEFPADWFEGARMSLDKNVALNYFKIDASMPLSHWKEKGWLHPDDPRGWFQWYCRYYYGRRMQEEDLRQIKRWKAYRRHAGAIRSNCKPLDMECRRKQRQSLLHWAYDSRKI